MHPPSIIQRTLTVGGVAISAALLVGALAVALRGIAPVPSSAATDPSLARTLRAIRAIDHSPPPHAVVQQLVAWRAPRIPKFHPPAPRPPIVVTVTSPPTVVSQPPAVVAPATPAAPVAPAIATSGDDGQQGGSDD